MYLADRQRGYTYQERTR